MQSCTMKLPSSSLLGLGRNPPLHLRSGFGTVVVLWQFVEEAIHSRPTWSPHTEPWLTECQKMVDRLSCSHTRILEFGQTWPRLFGVLVYRSRQLGISRPKQPQN